MKKELVNPIKFVDKVRLDGNEFNLDTLFNRVNHIYTNQNFLQQSMPASNEVLETRRNSLRQIFNNRVKTTFEFLGTNISSYLNEVLERKNMLGNVYLSSYTLQGYVEASLPFLLDVEWYFISDENQFNIMVADITMSIVTRLYQQAMQGYGYNNLDHKELKIQNNLLVDNVMLKAFDEIANTIKELRQEALNVYFEAGYPGLSFNQNNKLLSLSDGTVLNTFEELQNYVMGTPIPLPINIKEQGMLNVVDEDIDKLYGVTVVEEDSDDNSLKISFPKNADYNHKAAIVKNIAEAIDVDFFK